MAFRFPSKAGAPCVLARRPLLVPVTAMLLSVGTPAQAIILSGRGPAGGAAPMSADDGGRFAGVGRVECRDPATPGAAYAATGWVLGSADTVVTAAHVFFRGPRPVRAARAVDPANCAFILYDLNEQVRETIPVRYALSPWASAGLRNDSSYDVAVLKLDRPVKIDAIPVAMPFRGAGRALVDLVAFHAGAGEMQRAWITRGRLDDFPPGQLRDDRTGLRITSAPRLFSASADSSPGSSGGMYYDERLRAAIGVHLGALCTLARPRYDRDACFNYGLRFTPSIVAMVDMVVRDRPIPSKRIRADGDPARLVQARPERPRG
ncbi:serine protease [Rhizorhabdus sp.]|uniref:trypsin-like serine peptidase n=1 Tax=Rhizorhabdus sp. TaxID=1968843 RepID=UPI00121F3E39|nr:serine protease [Rhizorhabdus sp.]MBD3762113.1 trypsin-like peptidase domain-containing protein [Rhizorhabdus sp.]TAK10146.1 MAG: serine protease [Rhizorhabdus sp.]